MKTFLIAAVLARQSFAYPAHSDKQASCTSPRIRKEWRDLPVERRTKFVKAIDCMMHSPPKFKKEFPIVQSRYDDFVALHVNATKGGAEGGFLDFGAGFPKIEPEGVHGTGTFLHWHRYTLSIWEEALINECGWEGGIPYWNWHLDTKEAGGDWMKSPLFDPVSGFGGNGRKLAEGEKLQIPFGPPPGIPGFLENSTGGGCIQDGIFKDRKLFIGPMGKMDPNGTARCITRNFSPMVANEAASKKSISNILRSETFSQFKTRSDGPGLDSDALLALAEAFLGQLANGQFPGPPGGFPPGISPPSISPPGGPIVAPPSGMPGHDHSAMPFNLTGSMHVVGHAGIGGEMVDFFNSANDPLFFMHHACMDYLWSIWQDHDPAKRIYQYDTVNSSNPFDLSPLSANSPILMGVFAPTVAAKQVSDLGNRDGTGVLCIKYEGMPYEKYMS